MPTTKRPQRPQRTQLRDESRALLGLSAAFVPMDLPAGFDWERYQHEA